MGTAIRKQKTDASGYAIGSILSQNSVFLTTLSQCERNDSAAEKEALACIDSL